MQCIKCGEDSHSHKCPVCHKDLCEEHVLPESHKCKSRYRPKVHIPWIIPALFIIILFFSLIGYMLVEDIKSENIVVEEEQIIQKTNKTIIQTIEQNISFANIINNSNVLDTEQTLYGYLGRKVINIGYFAFIQDEFGNKITLTLNPDTRQIFENADANDIYKVKGMLQEKLDGLFVEVDSIEKSKRPAIKITKIIEE